MNRTQKPFISLLVATLAMGILPDAHANDHYNSSRSPLIETPFVRLPLGSVTADGWLSQQLILQKDGLTGHAEELYGDIGDSAWIGGANDSWERGPYYAKGLIPLAYILNDPGLKTKAQKWIDVVIASQRPNGDFGPRDRNWWPNMIVLYYMRDYYEATNDARVIPFMTNYFQFQLSTLSSHSLDSESGWAKARGGDNLDTVLWLYNHSGDSNLLDLADLLNSQTNDWASYYSDGTGNNWYPQHIVNVSQGLKKPALWYLRSGDPSDRDAFLNATGKDGWLMQAYGRIDGMYNGTEPLTDLSSTQGTELCSIVERILSNSIALRILGNPAIGDQMEKVAYNALPGDLKHDIKGLRYYSLMNQPKNTNEDLGFHHNGNGQNSITPSPHSGYGCCRSNFHFGWPKFVQHMWMGTSDNGLAIAAYGPNQVTAKVGSGVEVTIDQATDYPFRDSVVMDISTPSSVSFPLKLRIPAWCESPVVEVNGATMTGVSPGSYYTIDRLWSNGDSVAITFPMNVRSSVWINNSIGLERGPLVYSLLIEESWTETSSHLGNLFKTEEINPASPWNYGLDIADLDNPDADISVVESPMPTQPFKASDAPVKLILDARKVTSWGDFRTDLPGRATEPPLSPVVSAEPTEQVTLVPFGSTEIRTTYFPYVGNDIYSEFNFPITAQAGYGGTISPSGTLEIPGGGNQTFTIAPMAGCTVRRVLVDGVDVGAVSEHTFENIAASAHTITASFNVPAGSGSIPRTGQIYCSFLTDDLPASGGISSWSSHLPAGKTLTPQESPEVEVIDERRFVKNAYADADGLDMGTSSAIPCTGATIVVVVKPTRFESNTGWNSVVDFFYDRLVLGIMNESGKVMVRRNGSRDTSTTAIPDGQTTILSLVVQQNGTYKVYANGIEVMNYTGTSDMSSIVPGVAGTYANNVTFGRNWPDHWTTYNGYYGDSFVYTTALTDPERVELETYLINRLTTAGPTHTITASAAAGGAISPAGAVIVAEGANQAFAITPDPGHTISDVLVDGGSIGAAPTHTFNAVAGNHTISASFASSGPTHTITASASAGGTISPAGAVIVAEGANQTFTIAPDPGHTISDVLVDGGSIGAAPTHTFNAMAGNHTISASFASTGNTAPSASTVPDQNIAVDTSTPVLAFTVDDSQTPAEDLVVTAASSNLTVVPTSGVVLGGGGANRTVQVTPATGQTGSTTITLTVSDGDLTTPTSFQVTVAGAGNGLPDPDVVGPYRLVFATSTTPSGASDMGSLNAWVTSLAVAVPELDALGTTWSVIGATTEVGVFDNTDTEPGVDPDAPVYLMDGTLFAADLATFWSSGVTVSDGNKTLWITEAGDPVSNGATWVQTGLTTDGASPLPITSVGHELDSVGGTILHGGMDDGYNNATYPWYAGNPAPEADDWGGTFGDSGLFAISGVIGGGQMPLLITGTSYAGPGNDFIIDFTGEADTTYNVESSADLQDGTFIPIDGVTATTDESGEGTATVPAAELGSGRNFLRIAE